MADKDITIAVKVDGASTAAEDIAEVGNEVEDLGEDASTAEESLKQLVNLERAKAVESIGKAFGMVGAAVGNMRRELGGASPELDQTLKNVELGLNSVEGALSGAAQGFAVGGPLGAAIGGFVGLATGPLGAAFEEMTQDLKNAALAENNAAKEAMEYTRALELRREKLRELSFERFWAAEEQGITRATNALRRQNEELTARRGADSAVRETAQAAATDRGVPRADVSRADIVGDIRDRLAALEDQQTAAADGLALLEESATTAALEAADAASKGIDGFKDKKKEAEDLANELQEAKADLESSQAVAEEERRTIIADLGKRVLEETKALEEEASAAAEQVAAEVENSGAVLSESNKAGLEAVRKLTEDGRITAAEQQQLSAALEASIAGVRTNTDQLLRINEKLADATRGHSNRIGALERDVLDLTRRAVTVAPNR